MLEYDREAECYDATRGGDARADRAAEAIRSLIPADAAALLDVACGTGIVTVRLPRPGLRVAGVDRSAGMAAVAARRLPGRIAVGNAAALPLPPSSVDAVTMVWLLHLLDHTWSAAAVGEAARALRPGGVLITTVDKNSAAWASPSDVAALVWPLQSAYGPDPVDGLSRVTALAARHGLSPAGQATFTGAGQGRSPRWWRDRILAGRIGWARRADRDRIASLADALAGLPDPGEPRPDPIYQVVALRKSPA